MVHRNVTAITAINNFLVIMSFEKMTTMKDKYSAFHLGFKSHNKQVVLEIPSNLVIIVNINIYYTALKCYFEILSV